jgi:hypothetical protein
VIQSFECLRKRYVLLRTSFMFDALCGTCAHGSLCVNIPYETDDWFPGADEGETVGP